MLTSKDEDGDGIKEVRIVTAGIPMTYVFTNRLTEAEIKTDVNNITTNFFNTAFRLIFRPGANSPTATQTPPAPKSLHFLINLLTSSLLKRR